MNYRELRVCDIPCLDFMTDPDSESILYVGPKLSWWQRRKLRKIQPEFNVIYLYDLFKGITSKKLRYNFPGVEFPQDFSAETIYGTVRAAIEKETEVSISPESKFFVWYNGVEFVALEGTKSLDYAISYLKENGDNFSQLISCGRCCLSEELREVDPREIYDLDIESCDDAPEPVSSQQPLRKKRTITSVLQTVFSPTPEEVRNHIDALLMTGFPVEVIKSWLEDRVKLSRLCITRQFNIILVDYQIEVVMGPLPKAVFLFYLRHPEGVRFTHLQDYADELLYIYEHLGKSDDPVKMKASIDSLINPFNNSISEKCAAVKTAFRKKVNDDVAKHYYIRGAQGEKKGIALNRSLVEWECEL